MCGAGRRHVVGGVLAAAIRIEPDPAHSDAGSQYTAIHFGETLMLTGLRPSIGSIGDALDRALCETTIGLYTTVCIRNCSPFRRGPIRTLADLEDVASAWVGRYNASRLMHRLGRIPLMEAEAKYYARRNPGSTPVHHGVQETGTVQSARMGVEACCSGSRLRRLQRFTDYPARNLRSRRLLVTTNTDENAIAAPASIGLSSPAAASGNAAML
ncbi:hypothetical protein LAUMK35_02417 [Mycobacterium pseudokansasii]|uniref:Integrase catalytic domain-containing protein n=1 Tax=Mycobacterium pseudokansasii TaxID=2341080 RepID=A0A498QSJ7_9MYCO|nr:hypothetical protein LAUMK35_02417 [Mycobacterium pseudokansasii]VAZ94755.1 hypothetical protein LAUMK21_02418 [Mycobacterium pseudokansasii]VBA49991.1 hypothetical protein LAUMK142_02309 [Mycobacterium pseudokansasii]